MITDKAAAPGAGRRRFPPSPLGKPGRCRVFLTYHFTACSESARGPSSNPAQQPETRHLIGSAHGRLDPSPFPPPQHSWVCPKPPQYQPTPGCRPRGQLGRDGAPRKDAGWVTDWLLSQFWVMTAFSRVPASLRPEGAAATLGVEVATTAGAEGVCSVQGCP